MFPKLFQLGPVTLHTYGFFVALGFISAIYISCWLRRREGQPDADVSGVALWMVAAGIFFGRVAYVMEHWTAEFAAAPFPAVLRVDRGGLMFFGGFLGAVGAMALYARFRRTPFTVLSDVYSVTLPLGHALGRLGCFFYGCCHGKITSSWAGVRFPVDSPAWSLHSQMLCECPGEIPEAFRAAAAQQLERASLPVLPVQFIEAAANFAIFTALFFVYKRPGRVNGVVTGLYLMLYGVFRFLIELLRGDDRMDTFLGLSIGQTIALGVFLSGALSMAWALARKNLNRATNG